MTVLPLPYPTDKWSESLTPAEGVWQNSGFGTTTLDPTSFQVGQNSIRTGTEGTASYLIARFKFNTPINGLTYPDGKIQFYIACTANMIGTGLIKLYDSRMSPIRADISCNSAGIWEHKLLAFSDFYGNTTFDWSTITQIDIQMNKNALPAAFYIDEPYFTFNVPDSEVLIQSSPTGKSARLTTSFYPELFGLPADIICPSVATLAEGLPLTIQMDAVNFDHWADDVGNINPTRTVTVPVNNLTLQGVYAVSPNPLLVVDSFDKDMNNVSANSAVKFVYSGVPQVVSVPFAGRVGKGLWSLSVIDTATRTFSYWVLPDGTQSTESTITWDIQSDSRFEVHWSTITPDGGDITWLIGGGLLVGLGAGLYLWLWGKPRKRK